MRSFGNIVELFGRLQQGALLLESLGWSEYLGFRNDLSGVTVISLSEPGVYALEYF